MLFCYCAPNLHVPEGEEPPRGLHDALGAADHAGGEGVVLEGAQVRGPVEHKGGGAGARKAHQEVPAVQVRVRRQRPCDEKSQ
eukprot:4631901-Pyramimonas_sp.AAC.1